MMKPETVKTREKDNTETTQRQHRDKHRDKHRKNKQRDNTETTLRIKEVKTKETIDLRIPTYETWNTEKQKHRDTETTQRQKTRRET